MQETLLAGSLFKRASGDTNSEIRTKNLIQNKCDVSPFRDQIEPYKYQAAGHPRTFYLSQTQRCVYKITSAQEIEFYRSLIGSPDLEILREHAPAFGGVHLIAEGVAIPATLPHYILPPGTYPDSALDSVKLENLLFRISNPSYADLKLGKVLYCCCASEQKRNRMIQRSQETTSDSLGIRVSGYCRWDPASLSYKEFTKTQGYLLTESTILTAIRDFFTIHGESHPRPAVISEVIKSLTALRTAFVSTDVMLRSTSLFIAYSGSLTNSDPNVIVKIIDFARSHVTGRSVHGDGGFLHGLDNLIILLRKLVSASSATGVAAKNKG